MVDAQRLRSSFAAVTQHGDEVPLFFYSNLFLSHPDVREMFPVSMAGQRDKLVAALGRIITHVDDLDSLTPFLDQLGRDHRRFDVIAQHYPAVGASLLATLEHFLGDSWTAELAQDWRTAFDVVARRMLAAAEAAAATQPPWWDAEVTSHERRGLDIAVIRVRTDQPLHYRPGQSLAVQTDLRPRLWRYYSPANAPRDDHGIELQVRMVAGGPVSAALVQMLRPGDVLRLGAPIGSQLTLEPRSGGDLVFIAGGTGLAPLRALVDQLIQERANGTGLPGGPAPRQVSLFVGAASVRDLYDLPTLEALADQHSWLSVVPVVSGDAEDGCTGERGLVVDAALRSRPWIDAQVYVCGSPAMVAGSVDQLARAAIPLETIHIEDFGRDPLTTGGDGKEAGSELANGRP